MALPRHKICQIPLKICSQLERDQIILHTVQGLLNLVDRISCSYALLSINKNKFNIVQFESRVEEIMNTRSNNENEVVLLKKQEVLKEIHWNIDLHKKFPLNHWPSGSTPNDFYALPLEYEDQFLGETAFYGYLCAETLFED